MDERVNCMACLVADDEGMEKGAVFTKQGITHALAGTGDSYLYLLCEFDDCGTPKSRACYYKHVHAGEVLWTSPAVQEQGVLNLPDNCDP